jgi:polyhydroxyalkanoate synthesis repressor PhaR
MSHAPPKPIIIKKYANRRLYDTRTSCYITLDNLALMTRDGIEYSVIDAKSEQDITHTILTQIIMDEESRGATLLPLGFLRALITLYGDPLQAEVPHFLERALQAFRTHNGNLDFTTRP